MHEVVPKVVAIAVRMVMTKCMIFWMISFLFMALGVMSYEFFSPPSSCHSEERSDVESRVQSAALPLMKGARGMLTPKGVPLSRGARGV